MSAETPGQYCGICEHEFKPYEARHKMREEMPVANGRLPAIPFYVHVHRDCRDEYQWDRDNRPNEIAEQITPQARRSWA